MIETILQDMLKKGYPTRIVSVKHLKELQAEIEKLNDHNYLDKYMYKLFNEFHDFNLPDSPHPAKSIFIVASPSPRVKIYFGYKGKKIPVFIPPTYVEYYKKPTEINQYLNEILAKHGYDSTRVYNLPEKLIAVHSGLAEYGINNITYIPGIGSFYLLCAFYSDLPCTEDTWNEIHVMDACKNCYACLNKCPTSAIVSERLLIKAERCLTYHNEFKGTSDFPEWISPDSHNSLVGCLNCQINCPQNIRNLANIVELEDFTEEETSLILEKRALSDLPSTLTVKLEHLNLTGYYHHISDNLNVLITKNEQQKSL